jgi:molybdate transport system substrate-binding protein
MSSWVARALFVFLALPFAACAQAADLTVFAAASLKNALDAVTTEFQQQTGKRVAVSYAASSALARQIEQGAPADLFISADLDWMDYLEQRNLIRPETRHSLLSNRIVLVASADRPETLELKAGALAKALGDGRLAVTNVAVVPAGKYAKCPVGRSNSELYDFAQNESTKIACRAKKEAPGPKGIRVQFHKPALRELHRLFFVDPR